MKKIQFLSAVLLTFLGYFSYSQTPEQQKLIDDALRMQDSLMNSPEYKAAMQQIKDMEKAFSVAPEKPKTGEKKSVEKAINNDDFYMQNTMVADDNKKFPNWEYGTADIGYNYIPKGTYGNVIKFFKIGTIKADGNIVLDFPENVPTQTSLGRSHKLFLDINDISTIKYTNEDTGFMSEFSFVVMRDNKNIGWLRSGNSVKVTYNLATPCCLNYGDEGHRLIWAYTEKDCAMNADENWQGNVRLEDEPETSVNTHVNYNLNFKKGWNIIKTEIIGNQNVGNKTWYKTHKHTVISALPKDTRFNFRAKQY